MTNATQNNMKLFTLYLDGMRTNVVCRPMADVDAAIAKVADMFSGDEIRIEAAGEMSGPETMSADDHDLEDNNDGEV